MKTIKYLSILLLIISCKDDFEGPSLNDVFGPFELRQDFTNSADTINFEQENSMFFQAEFSKVMNWKITIEGNISGSRKEIIGYSKDLNIQNSTWNGNTTILPFFVSENCDVTLSFVESDTTFSTQLYVSGPKQYNDEESVLITDFEGGFNPNFTNFFQSTCTKSIESDNPSEGNRYLKQIGWCDWDWLIGYIDFYTQHWLEPNTLSPDPSLTFLNLMIYSDSALNSLNEPNTLFKIEIYEDENLDNYYDSSSEDMYGLEIPVNWNGWKMISLRYSDMPSLNLGNSVQEPDKVIKVRTLVLSDPTMWSSTPESDPQARADIDYLIWTKNQPILEK